MDMIKLRYNERGWIRILEASLAILLLAGVMLFIYSRPVERYDQSEEISEMQREILQKIATTPAWRTMVIKETYLILNANVNASIPDRYEFTLKVCNLTNEFGEVQSCNPDTYINEEDVYVEEIIISSDVNDYVLKRVRLFVWERD